jgi:beta-N-acetylhexosaminidase
MSLDLPLSKVCGQLLIGGFYGTELPASYAKALAAGERGGAVLFKRNLTDDPGSVAQLNSDLALAGGDLPPLIAVDQEGGRVARLGPPVLDLPPMRAFGRAASRDLLRRAARVLGTQLATMGFTMDFAPVLDVNTCGDNPVIGDRAFGSDPHVVARCGVAFAQGLDDAGILACGKHFPGHGDTSRDSHVELPVVLHDRTRLETTELLPFRAAIGAGVLALMTAHVVYESLDKGVPATMSRAVCASLLRAEMGFDGALFSDDLEMRAVSAHFPIEEAAVEAVWAGCDAILVCSNEELQGRAHEAIVKKAEKEPRFRARCTQAAERGLRIRRRVPPKPLARAAVAAALRRAVPAELEAQIARTREFTP